MCTTSAESMAPFGIPAKGTCGDYRGSNSSADRVGHRRSRWHDRDDGLQYSNHT